MSQANWYSLRLMMPVRPHIFGGRVIPDWLGKPGLHEGRVAET